MIQDLIKKDPQVKKFCLYGFLKNMKFFEPYLLIYLMSHNISLLEIGLLMAVRELVVNILEIPSGFVADYFGRKKELYLCFVFYIISFVLFYYTNSFGIALVAMIFFGCGEAFRSGSHKAMIYTYLDHKGWTEEKAFTYGLTRSVALVGSAVSSVVGIILILVVPNTSYIFLFSAVPYILDFLLIATYPRYLDVADKKAGISFSVIVKEFVESFLGNRPLKQLLLQEGVTASCLSYIKDFVQPLLEFVVLGSGIYFIANGSLEDNLNVALGVFYAMLNLVGAIASKKAYLVKKYGNNLKCLLYIQRTILILLLALSIYYQNLYVVFLLYFAIYAIESIRKPIYLEEIDHHIHKENRATILSVSAQMKSLFLMIFAPVFGYLADNFGMNVTLYLAVFLFVLSIIFACPKEKIKEKVKEKEW